MKLTNKIAIVTASTKGIGLESALILAKNGAKVYMAARNIDLFKKISDEYNNLDLNYVFFDATDKDSIKKSIIDVFSKEGRIDILVNNFGGSDVKKDKTIIDTSPEDFMKTCESNIMSVYITTHEACKIMMNQESGGSIINISSIGSINPDISRIGYVTSKSLINSLTENVACQMGKYNIRCNAILPGLIETNAVKQNLDVNFINKFSSSVPLKRIGKPNEIAEVVLFLASDMSSYITGQLLEVAGGFGKTTPIFGKD